MVCPEQELIRLSNVHLFNKIVRVVLLEILKSLKTGHPIKCHLDRLSSRTKRNTFDYDSWIGNEGLFEQIFVLVFIELEKDQLILLVEAHRIQGIGSGDNPRDISHRWVGEKLELLEDSIHFHNDPQHSRSDNSEKVQGFRV